MSFMDPNAKDFQPIARKKTFRGNLKELHQIRQFVFELCGKAPGYQPSFCWQVQLIVDEAFSNVIKHGRVDEGPIELRLELKTEGMLIEMLDQGIAFDPANAVTPDFSGQSSTGFGLFLIREIADSVAYSPKKGKQGWNHLRLFKKYQPEEQKMEIEHRVEEGMLVIRLLGETLDANQAPSFKDKIIKCIDEAKVYNILFDLSPVQFIDSSGLGCFLSTLHHVKAKGGDLSLASMNPSIKMLFQIVRMHRLFDIYESVEEALRQHQAKG